MPERQSAEPTTPAEPSHRWWVCCTWYDEDHRFWAHGDDGFETYQPCRNREEAFRVANDHRALAHPAPSWSVDVCSGAIGGRQLVHHFEVQPKEKS